MFHGSTLGGLVPMGIEFVPEEPPIAPGQERIDTWLRRQIRLAPSDSSTPHAEQYARQVHAEHHAVAWELESRWHQDALLKESLKPVPDTTVMANLRFQIGRLNSNAEAWLRLAKALLGGRE